MKTETMKKIGRITIKVVKVLVVIILIGYIGLMTYAINDNQNTINRLYSRINKLENKGIDIEDLYIQYNTKDGGTHQIHLIVDQNEGLFKARKSRALIFCVR